MQKSKILKTCKNQKFLDIPTNVPDRYSFSFFCIKHPLNNLECLWKKYGKILWFFLHRPIGFLGLLVVWSFEKNSFEKMKFSPFFDFFRSKVWFFWSNIEYCFWSIFNFYSSLHVNHVFSQNRSLWPLKPHFSLADIFPILLARAPKGPRLLILFKIWIKSNIHDFRFWPLKYPFRGSKRGY